MLLLGKELAVAAFSSDCLPCSSPIYEQEDRGALFIDEVRASGAFPRRMIVSDHSLVREWQRSETTLPVMKREAGLLASVISGAHSGLSAAQDTGTAG